MLSYRQTPDKPKGPSRGSSQSASGPRAWSPEFTMGRPYVPHVPCFPSLKKKLKQIFDLEKFSSKNDSLEVSAESQRFVSANPTEAASCHVEESKKNWQS